MSAVAAAALGDDAVVLGAGSESLIDSESQKLLNYGFRNFETMPLYQKNQPVTSLRALRPMEHAIGTLRASGLSDQEAVKAFRAFGGYIQGFVLAEVANLFGGDDVQVLPEDVSEALPIDELPHLAATLPYLFRCDFDDAFEYGLDLMIRGVEAKVAAESGRA